MIYTQIGGVIALVASALGAIKAFIGFSIAPYENYEVLARRYFGAQNSGEVINEGMMLLVFGMCLGILTEISRSLQSRG